MTSRTVITQGDICWPHITYYYIILKIIVHGCIDLQHLLSLDYCNLQEDPSCDMHLVTMSQYRMTQN